MTDQSDSPPSNASPPGGVTTLPGALPALAPATDTAPADLAAPAPLRASLPPRPALATQQSSSSLTGSQSPSAADPSQGKFAFCNPHPPEGQEQHRILLSDVTGGGKKTLAYLDAHSVWTSPAGESAPSGDYEPSMAMSDEPHAQEQNLASLTGATFSRSASDFTFPSLSDGDANASRFAAQVADLLSQNSQLQGQVKDLRDKQQLLLADREVAHHKCKTAEAQLTAERVSLETRDALSALRLSGANPLPQPSAAPRLKQVPLPSPKVSAPASTSTSLMVCDSPGPSAGPVTLPQDPLG